MRCKKYPVQNYRSVHTIYYTAYHFFLFYCWCYERGAMYRRRIKCRSFKNDQKILFWFPFFFFIFISYILFCKTEKYSKFYKIPKCIYFIAFSLVSFYLVHIVTWWCILCSILLFCVWFYILYILSEKEWSCWKYKLWWCK